MCASGESAAETAADVVAGRAVEAIGARGRFVWAVSGGSTPARFLAALARRSRVDWTRVHLFQVDERIAAPDTPQRNDTMIRAAFVDRCPGVRYHPIPVEDRDVRSALVDHLSDLERWCGTPARLDLVQLGLGADGHTASLVPADPVLDDPAPHYAITRMYEGTRRVTMTAPLLNAAHSRLFLVTGVDKDVALGRLAERDPRIPGSMITGRSTTLITDREIAGLASD